MCGSTLRHNPYTTTVYVKMNWWRKYSGLFIYKYMTQRVVALLHLRKNELGSIVGGIEHPKQVKWFFNRLNV